MTSRNLKRYEADLHAERRRATRALAQLRADMSALDDGDSLPDRSDNLDAAATVAEREVESVEAATQVALLERIDAALDTLVNRPTEFGRCERCGQPIAAARLSLVPWTRRCTRHAAGARQVVRPAHV